MRKWQIRVLLLIIGGVWTVMARQAGAVETDIVINEIMYNLPAANTGGEFVEIYNRGSTSVDVSNWQLVDSTQVMFTLPAGTTVAAGGYLVFYDDAAALAFYGLDAETAFGPYTGGLDGGGERIALKNAGRTVIDEVFYDDNWPWPSEADGNGPSLELWDPIWDNNNGSSWGIGQPYTPGTANHPASPGLGDVVITELMYSPGTLNTGGEYLELYNRSGSAIPLTGWQLAGGIEYTFPAVTLNAGAYMVVAGDPNVPGFYGISNYVVYYTGKLDNSGELIVLKNSLGQIVDVVNYEDTAPWPTEADGFGPSLELMDFNTDNNDPANWGIGQPYTPGAANTPALSGGGDIAITEIMYEPRKMRYMEYINYFTGGFRWTDGDDPVGEYIELFNRGEETIDLNGWELQDEDGVLFAFAAGTTLAPNHYLVVCQNSDAINSIYGISNLVGNFNPACNGLSGGGERLALLNANGVVVDTVHYNDTPPWPIGPDQTGVSLECLDPLADNNRPENWRGFSREGGPTHVWQYVETTGNATSNALYFYIDGAGEWLVDDIVVTPSAGGGDIMPNGSFEPDDSGWSKTGNHAGTYRTNLDAVDGTGCEHMVSTGVGGSSSNSLNCVIPAMSSGQEYTLSCWVKYLSGYNTLTFRLSYEGLKTTIIAEGGWQEAQPPANPSVGDEYALNYGTPGRGNSRSSSGLPPLADVEKIKHSPKRPISTDTVTVTAEVASDSPVTSVMLDYQVFVAPYQTATASDSVAMYDDGDLNHGDAVAGDGEYGAILPARSSQSLVRYWVTATNGSGSWRYPDSYEPNPNRAYFVYEGEEETNLPAYFLIAPQSTLQALNANPRTHIYYDATLVVDGIVYDHVGIHYKGQAWATGPKKSWKVAFNKTEYLRDMNRLDLAMHLPVMQKVIHDMSRSMGHENLGTDIVRLYLNGSFYGVELAEESPNTSWLEKYGFNDAGEVYKSSSCPPMGTWPYSAPEDEVSDLDYYSDPKVYPKIYEKKGDPLGSFTSMIDLTNMVTNTPNAQLLTAMMNTVDLDAWLYDWAVQVGMANSDIIGNNWFAIKPAEAGSKWLLRTFDYTHAFGCTASVGVGGIVCQAYNTDPYTYYNKWQQRCYQIPEFENRFLVIVNDVLTNYLTVEKFNTLLDEAYDRTLIDRQEEILLGYGGPYVMDASDYVSIKSYFANRRSWLLNTWLANKTFTPPANSHPAIALTTPLSTPAGIYINWTYADVEKDTCWVDLYWTDMKWQHLEPIPDANNIPAENGTFIWSTGLPAASQAVYVLAKIYDNQSYLFGYDLSSSIILIPDNCEGMQAAGYTISGDLNQDCKVDLQDILIFLQDWLRCYDPEDSDCTELP